MHTPQDMDDAREYDTRKQRKRIVIRQHPKLLSRNAQTTQRTKNKTKKKLHKEREYDIQVYLWLNCRVFF